MMRFLSLVLSIAYNPKHTNENTNKNTMAYLTQQQYERRTENAAIRMEKNKQISSLTEEQHEALEELCRMRHEMHSNMDAVTTSCENGIMENLAKVGVTLAKVGIPCPALPTHEGDYIDIDSIDTLYEIEDVPEDDQEKQDWYDDNYHRIMTELEELNSQIENYLRSIDEIHGTSYCPTGALRIM